MHRDLIAQAKADIERAEEHELRKAREELAKGGLEAQASVALKEKVLISARATGAFTGH